jgi:hypothetical protein
VKLNRTVLLLTAAAISSAVIAVAQAQTVKLDLAQTTPPRPGALTGAPPEAKGPMTLMLRGLDKITGRPSEITAPIGKPVRFATLTIMARYCYSTPPRETPETSAFVQIDDRRPDQPARRIFSGWIYASSPGLNAVDHPLYDVWAIRCIGGTVPAGATAVSDTAKVAAPDSSDREKPVELPPGASR